MTKTKIIGSRRASARRASHSRAGSMTMKKDQPPKPSASVLDQTLGSSTISIDKLRKVKLIPSGTQPDAEGSSNKASAAAAAVRSMLANR